MAAKPPVKTRPQDVIRQALLSNQDRVDLSRNRSFDAVPAVTSENDLGGGDDSFTAPSGLQMGFEQALNRIIAESGGKITINSGRRTNERQTQLWNEALAKYGDPEIADNWVARPGTSNHESGSAADLHYADDATRQWAHDNAGLYGLNFPLSNEAWHVEPVKGQSDGRGVPATSTGQTIPRTESMETTKISQPADRDWFMRLLEPQEENTAESVIQQSLGSGQGIVKRRQQARQQASGAINTALQGAGVSSGGTSGQSDPDKAWILDHESEDNVNADNPNSTAFGVGQLIRSNREAIGNRLGIDPETRDYNEQHRMMDEYVRERYGSYAAARKFWEQNGHY